MSLYNMLFGRNPASKFLLSLLGLDEMQVGRFRDCFLKRTEDGVLQIVVYTRNGGGNRPDYAHVTDFLQAHPDYVRDCDDDFDSTYASYYFSVPAQFQQLAESLTNIAEHPEEPGVVWQKLIENLNNKEFDDPRAARALEVGKELFSRLDDALKKDNHEPA